MPYRLIYIEFVMTMVRNILNVHM